MNFSFDAYDKINVQRIFLAYPNRKIICYLNAKEIKTNFLKVGISSVSFKIYKYKEQQEVTGYNDISIGKYIYLDNLGWYRITDIKEENNGLNPFYNVTCYDLSIELKYSYLTSFGSMGTESDSQGGLDRYALYAPNDQTHSIAHIFMSKNPGWSFKYIDDDITTERRSFNNDSVTSYDFLTGDVADTFECLFTFDGNERTVSAYKIENFGRELPIVLSYHNLIKEINISWNEDSVRTMFNVSGGNDVTGTALSIAAVNSSGNGIITNLTYYYKDMSNELKTKLEEYYNLMDSSKGKITTAISQLKNLQNELFSLDNKMPSVETSTDWTQYGLVGLKAKSAEYKTNISTLISKISIDPVAKQQHDTYSDFMNAVDAEITVRQNQITTKKNQITAKKNEVSSYVINIKDILGEKLYLELRPFLIEDNFCDDSYIATESMTDNEILEMKQSLYDHAVSELKRVCFPQFDMTVNSVNFPVLAKYKNWTKQLEIGDIITIKYSDDIFIKARLLKMELNWDDFTDFKLTFSSKTSLEDGWFEYDEMKKLADRSSSTLDYRTGGWSEASKQANSAYDMGMQEFLDLSMKQIVNTKNQRITTDETGMLFSEWLPDQNKFAPEKMWLTNGQMVLYDEEDGTNLKVPNIAIGRVYINDNGTWVKKYGIAAPNIWGDFTFSKYLTVKNENNTMTMNQNGLTASATNGFSVKINPDDPNNIFSIMNNGSKLMYIDATNKKLVFKGRAEIDEGYIGGWTINNNRLFSGGVGMSSDTTAGAIAYWAGNSNSAIAPFRVDNQGRLYASNVEITGGSLAIGNNFRVDNQGRLTAQSVNITNGILNIGNGLFRADYNGVSFGDYYVSADGSGTLQSSNGYVNISDVVTTGPSGEFANMTIGSDLMNNAVEISGTGDITTARVTCRHDYYFTDPWTAKMGALDMFKQIYNRLDAIRYSIQNMGGNVDWD